MKYLDIDRAAVCGPPQATCTWDALTNLRRLMVAGFARQIGNLLLRFYSMTGNGDTLSAASGTISIIGESLGVTGVGAAFGLMVDDPS